MRSLHVAWLFLAAFVVGLLSSSVAEAAPPPGGVPDELADWVKWVEEAKPEPRDCRLVEGGVAICVWPSSLDLDVGADGARFELDVSVFGPMEAELPGDAQRWPQDVKIDGKTSAVLREGEGPRVELEEGRHVVTGFIPWRTPPSSLRVPRDVGLIDLVVRGMAVPFPSRSDATLSLEGAVVDEESAEPEEPKAPEDAAEPEPDSETIEVSRRLVDGVPLTVLTRIDLHIAGEAREFVMPNPMLEGSKLLRVTSPVPVVVGEGGTLVLQVRRGTFSVELEAVLPRSPTSLRPPEHAAPWPDDEVWVWNAAPAGAPGMGQVSLSGARPVDHARTHAPSEWQGGATYRLDSEGALQFEVIQRGVSETSTNELVLRREMKVDLAGTGWTVVDDISGEMNAGNRLDLRVEQGVLGSVAARGEPQVVTVSGDGHTGVEVRGPAISMRATWRLEGATATLPLGGWSEDFDAVDLAFELPRGWDLLYADGPGSLEPTWLGAWRPLDLIVLLGVVVLVGRVVGVGAGVAALIGLGLAYTRNGDGYVMLLVLVGVLAALMMPLRRTQSRRIEVGLRGVWAIVAFVVTAWVIWRVPAGVAAVWRDGLSGLAHVAIERDLEAVMMLAMVLTVVAAGTLGMAFLSTRTRPGLVPAVGAGLFVVVAAGLAFATLGGTSRDSVMPSAADDSVDFSEVGAKQESLAAAPPADLEPESDFAPGSAKESASNVDEDVWSDLNAEEIAEANGVGGLGLVGTGRGGGGDVDGAIGLDTMSPAEKGNGDGEAGVGSRGQRFVATDVDLPEIEPPAVPQTGEGVPAWSGPRWTMTLGRTVKRDETVTLWLVSPTVSRIVSVVRALALLLMAFLLLRAGWLARPAPAVSSTAAKAGATVAALLMLFVARPASAAPPAELLEQLAERVNAVRPLAPSPACGTRCALVNKLEVTVADAELSLRAEVHMAGPGVWALPGPIETWTPRSVEVDGKPARAMAVYQGKLLLHLDAGLHAVELGGPLGADDLDLDLAGAPKHVVVSAEGWTVQGVDEHDLAQSLHFERERGGDQAVDPDAPDAPDLGTKAPDPADPERQSRDMEPWFALQRHIQIGPRWTVQTTVTRLNHGPSPTTLRVPLLPGESMLEATGTVDDPKATVTLRAPGESITWTSVLESTAALELSAPTDRPWTESWSIHCGGAWQCSDEGTPATVDSGGTRVFHPWPGESLSLTFVEPSPADGQLLAVDAANLQLNIGETGTDARLTMTVRTATVGERTITVPTDAHVGSVKMDGNDVPMAKDATELRLTFQPGLHQVEIEFQLDAGSGSMMRAPVVGLGGRAVNARVIFNDSSARERVVVWTSGEGLGPVVWLWPYLGVLALLSILLARFTTPPLNALQWFLLSLGFSVLALPVVWAWFVLVQWRERFAARLQDPIRHNAVLIGLGLLALLVVGVVAMTGIELLSTPPSTIVHSWSDGPQLSWYQDRVESHTPEAMVVSVPISLWRALWVVWVVWLAWSAIAWSKWAYRVASADGWLRSRPAAAKTEPEEAAPAQSSSEEPAAPEPPARAPEGE